MNPVIQLKVAVYIFVFTFMNHHSILSAQDYRYNVNCEMLIQNFKSEGELVGLIYGRRLANQNWLRSALQIYSWRGENYALGSISYGKESVIPDYLVFKGLSMELLNQLQRASGRRLEILIRDQLMHTIYNCEYAQASSYKRTPSPPKEKNKEFESYTKSDQIVNSKIPLIRKGNHHWIQAVLNDKVTCSFMLDTGASDVIISKSVLSSLIRSGTLTKSDYIESRYFTLADGSRISCPMYKIDSFQMGDLVFYDLKVAVMRGDANVMLLGSSLLERIGAFELDYQENLLVVRNE